MPPDWGAQITSLQQMVDQLQLERDSLLRAARQSPPKKSRSREEVVASTDAQAHWLQDPTDAKRQWMQDRQAELMEATVQGSSHEVSRVALDFPNAFDFLVPQAKYGAIRIGEHGYGARSRSHCPMDSREAWCGRWSVRGEASNPWPLLSSLCRVGRGLNIPSAPSRYSVEVVTSSGEEPVTEPAQSIPTWIDLSSHEVQATEPASSLLPTRVDTRRGDEAESVREPHRRRIIRVLRAPDPNQQHFVHPVMDDDDVVSALERDLPQQREGVSQSRTMLTGRRLVLVPVAAEGTPRSIQDQGTVPSPESLWGACPGAPLEMGDTVGPAPLESLRVVNSVPLVESVFDGSDTDAADEVAAQDQRHIDPVESESEVEASVVVDVESRSLKNNGTWQLDTRRELHCGCPT